VQESLVKGGIMAELNEAADQFAKDLLGMNLAGLMMSFTPDGLGKAMAMQAQMQAGGGGAAPGTATHTLKMLGQEGDDHMVDIHVSGPNGDAVISTRWRDVAGAWKVNDIGLKA
jgi:hypothetical protein